MNVLLITPPLLQCNAPYSATPLLTARLREQGHDVAQADASLDAILRLLSLEGLERIRRELNLKEKHGASGLHFLDAFDYYAAAIEPVIALLQGRDFSIAHRIVANDFLPRGPRFDIMIDQETDERGSLGWAFGEMGVNDQAHFLASLMIDDLVQVVREEIDPDFGFSRYGEQLSVAPPSFDPVAQRLAAEPTLIDRVIDEVTEDLLARHSPQIVGFTVPFPGTLYGALRMAAVIRRASPSTTTILGGGYISTELRDLNEPRLFDLIDYVCLDEGVRALDAIIRRTADATDGPAPPATFMRRKGKVVRGPGDGVSPVSHARMPAPVYDGLQLDRYVSVTEMLNPMHALWSGCRWNRLMLVHGCYWHRCRFCDTGLDYIRRYDPAESSRQVDWIEEIVTKTGRRGFHFVDEALAPSVLRGLAEELLRRKLVIAWWGNVRFEKGITLELAELLSCSGCIAVTGGLEAPDDRLLAMMNKGYTVAQATRACAAFASNGIMVHAYLMYGLPTQTVQETVDGLELVRQLFEAGLIHSAFWHRFAATVHSDIGKKPSNYGVELLPRPEGGFARNSIPFVDTTGVDHESLGRGLRKALYNYMHGVGLDQDTRSWFDAQVPPPSVRSDEIEGFIGV
ncbi:MAG: radical SAM protein [Chitinivibrionales bacterium]|nr:radical SAM protein [Chitinivibrionales bacterium]MBD3358253.1 radical SAM protein [Chitinivibrionales bacterium]